MLSSFEPEMESRWPFSAAAMDINIFPGIQRDSLFSLNPASSLGPIFSGEIDHCYAASTKRTVDCLLTPQPSIEPTATVRVQKMNMIWSDRGNVLRETKKQKICPCPSWPSGEASVSTKRLAKTPARRSQKIGDRVTALQQLVSRYGKTDIASVLHEASIYVKARTDPDVGYSLPWRRETWVSS